MEMGAKKMLLEHFRATIESRTRWKTKGLMAKHLHDTTNTHYSQTDICHRINRYASVDQKSFYHGVDDGLCVECREQNPIHITHACGITMPNVYSYLQNLKRENSPIFGISFVRIRYFSFLSRWNKSFQLSATISSFV